MHSALLFLLALQGGSQPPLIPAFFTGETLYEICSRPNAGQCSMYVAGVLDGLFYARAQEQGPPICPARINNREAAQVVTDYLEQNPAMRSRAAAVGVRQALAERLDCGGDQQSQTGSR